MTSAKPPYEIIDLSWARILAPVEPTVHEIEERPCQEVASGVGYLLAGTDVLCVFTYSTEDVRALIVGQDPYPTPGHPVGLSFSMASSVRSPRSLESIFHELVSDLGVPRPTSGDLTSWRQQDVMLLNRVLAAHPGALTSHKDQGWEEATQRAIEALVERGGPLMAILWGWPAQSLAPMLRQTPIVTLSYPSPLPASRGLFGSHPSSRTNAILTEMGVTPVDWRLP